MSDNENQPPAPSKQTSSVPLKKETVRVTLKAADAPPAVPSATVPMAPPVRPPVPTAPPAPTAPGGPPRASAPAPTIPLRTAGAPTAKASAPTIRLATSKAPAAPGAGPGLPGAGGVPTMALPKATMQLQPPTQPLGSSFSSPAGAATMQADEEDDEERGEGIAGILSIVGFIAALVVLAFQIMTATIWVNATDNPQTGQWSQLME